MKKYQDNNTQLDSALDTLRGMELSPPAAVWGEVQASLNAKRKTRFIWLFGSFLLAGLLLGFAYWLSPFGAQDSVIAGKTNRDIALEKGTITSNPTVSTAKDSEAQALVSYSIGKSGSTTRQQSHEVNNIDDQNIAAALSKDSENKLVISAPAHSGPMAASNIGNGNNANQSGSETDIPATFINKELQKRQAFSETPLMQPKVVSIELINAFEVQELASTASPIKPKKKITESRFALGLAAGTFNQNLRVANVESDSIAFYARPGAQFQASISYAVNDKLSMELGIGYSYNTWESPARLIVAPTTDILPASTDTVVFISTPYLYNQITDIEQAQGLSKNYDPDQQVQLEHNMRYMSYRLGIAYKLVDYRKLCFNVLLQADYLRVLSYSGRFETPSYSMEYPVNGFRESSWGIRPGIGLSYRLIPGLQLLTEAATIIRTSHLVSQPNWKLYENPYGLVAGIRIGW